ncbi:MAG: hypothetical protein QW405_00250, partial [Fervidicoccaceae archaeon]
MRDGGAEASPSGELGSPVAYVVEEKGLKVYRLVEPSAATSRALYHGEGVGRRVFLEILGQVASLATKRVLPRSLLGGVSVVGEESRIDF